MKSEIKIILEEGSSNKAKGNCFENLVRNLLSIQHYEIRGNINFSGMEIDLVAEHKHDKGTLYVECKAKEKVSSDEITKFGFNVNFKEVDKGYFFRTQELESQAGALLSEIRSKEKYKNLKFFEPDEMICMLEDGKMVFEPKNRITSLIISKRILAITYLGDFFIYLINESNAFPTKFLAINAKENSKPLSQEQISLLQRRVEEITNLKLMPEDDAPSPERKIAVANIESISEVQESENWYDYLPASAHKNHFVGRVDIRTKILTFFKEIRIDSTPKRIFYLNGKSGWGKSSLVLELKERCRNKHYRNNFYCIAIDTRSAISDNFVALAFSKLIEQAYHDEFLFRDMFSKPIMYTSNFDLLSSDSIIDFFEKLKTEKKYLVLIFDQFEDVFRKKDYFKTFYKFLSDVTDKRPNLIIGFSWKSDFFIQSDDPSYHIWQQAKEQAREFTIDEFSEKEIDGIIKQLEDTVGRLEKSIKDRIKESSQGLPWLTKKLCIHIYDQISQGLDKEKLIESNLNILDLFDKDGERISPDELRALKVIAKRAYDGSFFDEAEVGDLIESNTITSLLHKRLIIRSGANYNIYWDIYRDYLVTGDVPPIGESYLLRQSANVCLEVFLLFEQNRKETIYSLQEKHRKEIGNETLNNVLIELRNLGVVQKEDDDYYITPDLEISKEGLITFVTAKFFNYTPYLSLKKQNLQKILKSDIVEILKTVFKQEFQDATWEAYANVLISWFLFSELDIKNRISEPIKGRTITNINLSIESQSNFLPRASVREILEIVPLLSVDKTSINSRYYRDLFIIGLVDHQKNLTEFGKSILLQDESLWPSVLKKKVLELPKMAELKTALNENPKLRAKDLLKLKPKDFFDGTKESSKIVYATNAISWVKNKEKN